MVDFLTEYWWTIVVAVAALTVIIYSIVVFAKRPTSEQIKKVKEWLLYAVTEAEKALGSGTGQIKLRYVYDMFLGKFPYLTKVISFDLFSNLVDEVLEQFRDILDKNEQVKTYVDTKETTIEVKATPAESTGTTLL